MRSNCQKLLFVLVTLHTLSSVDKFYLLVYPSRVYDFNNQVQRATTYFKDRVLYPIFATRVKKIFIKTTMESILVILVVACFAIYLVHSQHQHGVPQQQYMVQQPVGGVPQQVPQGYGSNQHQYAQAYQQIPQQGAAVSNQNLIRDKSHIQDREHIKEHLQGVVDHPDVAKMSEEELQFHYFKMHDNDDNNKLDGCELIKSLIHWHVEESKHLSGSQGQQGHNHGHGAQTQPPPPPPQQAGNATPGIGTTKIFTEQELSMMIDPILDMDDRNKDGFIDYPEFVAAQQSRGF